MKFILASKSPRRKKILDKLNLKFRVIPSKVDESSVKTTINPVHYCMQLAELKATAISAIIVSSVSPDLCEIIVE